MNLACRHLQNLVVAKQTCTKDHGSAERDFFFKSKATCYANNHDFDEDLMCFVMTLKLERNKEFSYEMSLGWVINKRLSWHYSLLSCDLVDIQFSLLSSTTESCRCLKGRIRTLDLEIALNVSRFGSSMRRLMRPLFLMIHLT